MKEKLLVSLCIRTCAVASKARARHGLEVFIFVFEYD